MNPIRTVPLQYTLNDYGVETGYDWWSLQVATGACEINNVNITNAFIIDADSNSLIVSQRPDQVSHNITIDFDFVDASDCSIRFVKFWVIITICTILVLSWRRKHVPQYCLKSTA